MYRTRTLPGSARAGAGRGCSTRRSRHHRNAARVLPLPVGAWISVLRPALIAAQPCAWAGVGASNVASNQALHRGPEGCERILAARGHGTPSIGDGGRFRTDVLAAVQASQRLCRPPGARRGPPPSGIGSTLGSLTQGPVYQGRCARRPPRGRVGSDPIPDGDGDRQHHRSPRAAAVPGVPAPREPRGSTGAGMRSGGRTAKRRALEPAVRGTWPIARWGEEGSTRSTSVRWRDCRRRLRAGARAVATEDRGRRGADGPLAPGRSRPKRPPAARDPPGSGARQPRDQRPRVVPGQVRRCRGGSRSPPRRAGGGRSRAGSRRQPARPRPAPPRRHEPPSTSGRSAVERAPGAAPSPSPAPRNAGATPRARSDSMAGSVADGAATATPTIVEPETAATTRAPSSTAAAKQRERVPGVERGDDPWRQVETRRDRRGHGAHGGCRAVSRRRAGPSPAHRRPVRSRRAARPAHASPGAHQPRSSASRTRRGRATARTLASIASDRSSAARCDAPGRLPGVRLVQERRRHPRDAERRCVRRPPVTPGLRRLIRWLAVGARQPGERPGPRHDPVHVVPAATRREPAPTGPAVRDRVDDPRRLRHARSSSPAGARAGPRHACRPRAARPRRPARTRPRASARAPGRRPARPPRRCTARTAC